MDVQYAPEARQCADELTLLEQASDLLTDILGPQSSALVKADWQRLQNPKGRTFYRLTLQDFTGSVSSDFTSDELANPLHMRVRLYRLWGDLLQVRNNQQHQQVQLLSDQITADQQGH